MSLQGSFETIALRDVMALLASSHKSGELRVVGGQTEGRLWMQDGLLVGSKVGKSHGHVDALFELLRLTEGNFVFKDGVEAPAPEEPAPVEPLMNEAEGRLQEWDDIKAVVPSLEHRVRLLPDLPTPEVTLSAEEWHLVMAVALAATVRGVLDELLLGQFEGCRGIRRLVDAGLVIVEAPRVRPSVSDPSRAARRAAAASPDAVTGSPRVVHRPAPAVPNGFSPSLAAAVAEAAGSAALPSDSVDAPLFPTVGPAVAWETVAGTAPSPFESPFESPYRSPEVGIGMTMSARPDQFPAVYGDQADGLDVVDRFAVVDQFAVLGSPDAVDHLPESEEQHVALPYVVGSPQDQLAVHALRGRRARMRALAGHDESAPVDYQASGGALSAPPAQAGEGNDASGGSPEHDPGGDSINRGLLLKFLSSVRS